MSTVGSTALLGCLVDLNMLDDQVTSIEAFGVCVGLGILKETEKKFGGLLGPAGFGDTELFSCAVPLCQHHIHPVLFRAPV